MNPPEYGQSAPVKVFKETDIIRNSNTWEYLIFEQLRMLKNIQANVFSDPATVEFSLMNLIVATLRLESLLYDRIDPLRNGNSNSYLEYLSKKPEIFKNLTKDISGIKNLIRKDLLTQLRLVAYAEKWFLALDEYMGPLKKIDVGSFDMEIPDENNLGI